MDEPKINEILLRDKNVWLHFSRPSQIIIAENLSDILPVLGEIEDRVQQDGLYAAGFLSYESAPAFDAAHLTKPKTDFPYLWFGLYPEPHTVNLPHPTQRKPTLDWQPTVDRNTYNTAIEKIKEYIADGRTYQVNYTMRLQTTFNVSAWEFFLHLAQSQNNHAAYINSGRYVICSASPELFFELDGNTIIGRPMKGTVRRGRTTQEDQAQAEWLKQSEKNRAENVMIVDMIRNDLGRIARTGTVQVPELFHTERYPTLWQMTSTVTAQTKASLTDIFRALFPCASITGAPKVSTMRIINELETTPRNIYTGSIGYFSPQRKASINVAIRTALIDRQTQTAEYGIGGGIGWDSTSNDEYSEALLKARVLTESPLDFSLLETMLWTPKEGFFLKEKHIARLLDSADYFGFPISQNEIEEELAKIESKFTTAQRIRFLLDKSGKITSEATPYQPTEKVLQVRLAKESVNSNNVFLFHKTTVRDMYDVARADSPDCDDVLFYNEHSELTEFTIGNLVVELEGQLVTPPIKCGLLAGTFRDHLVETGQAIEKAILVSELERCTNIFRVNSIRKWEIAHIQPKGN
jgi:para-aminobenzoate synthetase/4-amino-4-deoxychorismate lyase